MVGAFLTRLARGVSRPVGRPRLRHPGVAGPPGPAACRTGACHDIDRALVVPAWTSRGDPAPSRDRVGRLSLGMALVVGGLLVAPPAHGQNLRLRVTPTSISFPDANPTTTPLIPANTSVLVDLRVRGGPPSSTWSVQALAGGDLTSGPDSIAISNITWTSTQTGRCRGSCTCLAGTTNKTVQQLMISGQGRTGNSFSCTQNYSLANSWSYNPGSYMQVMTITASSP